MGATFVKIFGLLSLVSETASVYEGGMGVLLLITSPFPPQLDLCLMKSLPENWVCLLVSVELNDTTVAFPLWLRVKSLRMQVPSLDSLSELRSSIAASSGIGCRYVAQI